MSQPHLRTIPSTDVAFGEHVERLLARHRFATPGELAARLRKLFPRVVVRASEVSGQGDTWYVYRDGVWSSGSNESWWEDPRSPRITITRDGWIESANPPARALLGLSQTDEMPRFFSDFAAPGTLDDATALFGVVAAGNELTATVLVRPTTGDVIACEVHVSPEADHLVVGLRLADDIPVQHRPAQPTQQRPLLQCHPPADVLFARYAGEALGRIPEPTPDGLELRLRRLYPHARVQPGDDGWTVYRDGDAREATDERWWLGADLPTVRYDGQGRIIEANAAAERLLGAELVGRHWQELVTTGTTDQVATVLNLIAEVGWAESRFRMPGADGYLFEFDSYTELSGETFTTIMRARPHTEPAVSVRT